ncbi:mechanosensitive ion channel protein [Tepiditoga spiralis]|uniref:Mechanosensitive ion channel protein n=1 Tax=Tepiditoga spiralis TaxID=2108365 RepID=A0A7G1GB45_9BACT|nr:mechanosensitive ion channel family protein [Tepiditoga spiralis]BBE31542.1 mechanosensitive ion channel protein [Tepiditoga spiralis]
MNWLKLDIIIDYSIRIGASLLLLFLTKVVSNVLYNAITKNIKLKYKNSTKSLINLASYTFSVFIIISILFKDFMPFLTGMGISGIIVGLAVKEPVSNFICGILIMMNKIFLENEAVEINDVSGTIEEITLNHVLIKTWDGKLAYIPNNIVWSSKIIHYWPENIRRNELIIGISYESNIQKALSIINETLKNFDIVDDENHSTMILFDSFNSSSIDFNIKFWVKKEDFFTLKMNLAKKLKEEFDKNGIEIPYQKIDLKILK